MIKQLVRNITLVLLVGLLIFVLIGCSSQEEPPPEQEPEQHDQEPEEEEEKTLRVNKTRPVSVIINNHSTARPQSGLQQASYVYEFLVEGGMTRLLAVYDDSPEEDYTIGPIRSLRPYFAVQALEHGGIIAHSGASHRTNEIIRGMGIKQIYNYNHFWRDSSRNAPHNLYTSIKRLHNAAREEFAVTKKEYIKEEAPAASQEGLELEISYSSHYKVKYTFDSKTKTYLRFVNNSPNKDRETGKQYRAQRIIVRETPHQRVSGSDLVDIRLEGEGKGFLYEWGKKHPISWEKSGSGTTQYFYQNGESVETGWGNTWVQVVQKLN